MSVGISHLKVLKLSLDVSDISRGEWIHFHLLGIVFFRVLFIKDTILLSDKIDTSETVLTIFTAKTEYTV
jgi:hypothetical protein